MSLKALILSSAVVIATIGPAFASSGTTLPNDEQGQWRSANPSLQVGEYLSYPPMAAGHDSTLTRAQVLKQLEQAQQRSANPSLQIGEHWSYP